MDDIHQVYLFATRGGDLPTASGEPKKGPEANGLTKTKKYRVPFDYVL